METLVLILDLVGTFVFALSGAMTGVRHRLDVFGVLVLSFAAGNAGGIIRDLCSARCPRPRSRTGATSRCRSSPGLATFRGIPQHPACSRRGAALRRGRAWPSSRSPARSRRSRSELNPSPRCSWACSPGSEEACCVTCWWRRSLPSCGPSFTPSRPSPARPSSLAARSCDFSPTPLAIVGALLCFGLRLVALRRDWRCRSLVTMTMPSSRSGQAAPARVAPRGTVRGAGWPLLRAQRRWPGPQDAARSRLLATRPDGIRGRKDLTAQPLVDLIESPGDAARFWAHSK